jgi:hypothetical protein
LKRSSKLFIKRKWLKKVSPFNPTPPLALRKRLLKSAGTWALEMMKMMIKWVVSSASREKNQNANF